MIDARKQLAGLFERDGSDGRTMRRLALKAAGHDYGLHAQVEAAINMYETKANDGRFVFDMIDWADEAT